MLPSWTSRNLFRYWLQVKTIQFLEIGYLWALCCLSRVFPQLLFFITSYQGLILFHKLAFKDISLDLTLSQTNPGFYVSAKQAF